jgi:chromosome partitioning protein
MPVVAVVNRKGGSGKSTLATHLAAHCAHSGIPVMLGDVDKQQSTQAWLKLRARQELSTKAPIVGWTVDPRSVLRSPPGVTHVVLDTPGGLRGFELARVAIFADAIIMPVCNSVFDRESAADCYAELMTMPRVASGRCKVAAVGMRVDARTKGDEMLREWAAKHKIPFIGVLRETQGYVRCVEQGLTLFDMPAAKVETDIAQWQAILQWLQPVLYPPAAAPLTRPVATGAMPLPPGMRASSGARVDSLKPAQASLLAYQKEAPQAKPVPPAPARASAPARPTMITRVGSLLGSLGMARFLQR